MMNKSIDLSKRMEILLFVECRNGNLNGDMDDDNRPRTDEETGIGLVSDVCTKRKIRNYVEEKMGNTPGFNIYVKKGIPLNRQDQKAYEYYGIKDIKQANKDDPSLPAKLHDFMCKNFYDIRMFGAVMNQFVKDRVRCGNITGPIQFEFGTSVEPISVQEQTITRLTVTREEDLKVKDTDIGHKFIVPYALYEQRCYYSPNRAKKTGVSQEDMELFFDSLLNMYEVDHSASRGSAATRKIIIFQHSSELGDCPAYKLFEAVKVKRKEGVDVARSFTDYEFDIDYSQIPETVKVTVI